MPTGRVFTAANARRACTAVHLDNLSAGDADTVAVAGAGAAGAAGADARAAPCTTEGLDVDAAGDLDRAGQTVDATADTRGSFVAVRFDRAAADGDFMAAAAAGAAHAAADARAAEYFDAVVIVAISSALAAFRFDRAAIDGDAAAVAVKAAADARAAGAAHSARAALRRRDVRAVADDDDAIVLTRGLAPAAADAGGQNAAGGSDGAAADVDGTIAARFVSVANAGAHLAAGGGDGAAADRDGAVRRRCQGHPAAADARAALAALRLDRAAGDVDVAAIDARRDDQFVMIVKSPGIAAADARGGSAALGRHVRGAI